LSGALSQAGMKDAVGVGCTERGTGTGDAAVPAPAGRPGSYPRLGQDRSDDFAGDVGEAETAALIFEGETLVINPEQAEHGGVEIVNVDRVFDDVIPELAGFADDTSRLHTTAGQPHGETAGMMVTAIIGAGEFALGIVGPAELAAPDDQGVLKQTALF